MVVRIPQNPWYGDDFLELDFPASWEVVVCRMAGENAPKLNEEGIQSAFLNPIGTNRIKQLAQNKKEVAILFDDMSRPTKVAELVPYVLQELKEAGIKDDNIRFVAALGAHGAMKLTDFTKKLGPEIPRNYRVYNHNPYENCTFLGKTSRGTPVSINSEVMSCDLKIAIGAILPHPLAGFGGGGKIILPGVSHIDTMWANHANLSPGQNQKSDSYPAGTTGVGELDGNALRLDAEEAARMAGLDIIINAVVNLRRDTVGLFVGDLVAAHREGVKFAERIYTTDVPSHPDVIVVNNYCKANEASIGLGVSSRVLPPEGSEMVIIGNIPEGQASHYLLRSFGKNIGGRLWHPITELGAGVKRLIVLGPAINLVGLDWIGPPDKTIVANSWSEIINILQNNHHDTCKVAIIPDATIQYFPAN